MTQFEHRCLVIIPAARQAAMNAYWKANLDPRGGEYTFTVGLNASGKDTDPPTHYWCYGSFKDTELAKIAGQLASEAKVASPPKFDELSKAAKSQWLTDNKGAITAGAGIVVVRDDAADVKANPDAELAALGLKRIQAKVG